MRVALAGFLHETNTFAPVPAGLDAFEAGGGYIPLSRGPKIAHRAEGVNLGIAGALAVACRRNWQTVPILWAGAIPSSKVTEAAFETIADEILAGLRTAGPLTGVFLDLHGAMVADHVDDGEGEIARHVRDIVGPNVPIVAALDLHGNISEAFARTVDGLVGFRTYPHVDMAKTGARAADLLHAIMTEGTQPVCAFRRMDYLVPIPFQTTDTAPADALYADLARLDARETGVRAASLFMGFPAADIHDCGPMAVVYADTQVAADDAADAIASAYAAAEDHFVGSVYDADTAIAEGGRTRGAVRRSRRRCRYAGQPRRGRRVGHHGHAARDGCGWCATGGDRPDRRSRHGPHGTRGWQGRPRTIPDRGPSRGSG